MRNKCVLHSGYGHLAGGVGRMLGLSRVHAAETNAGLALNTTCDELKADPCGDCTGNHGACPHAAAGMSVLLQSNLGEAFFSATATYLRETKKKIMSKLRVYVPGTCKKMMNERCVSLINVNAHATIVTYEKLYKSWANTLTLRYNSCRD